METVTPVGCTIKALPREMLIPAARVAVEEDPRNEPPVQYMATAISGDESNAIRPEYIAALTGKYFGPQTRVLPTYFVDNPNPRTRQLIIKYLNLWDCGVTFRETANVGDSRIRIGRGPLGHFSYLGTDNYMIPLNQITMNLQDFTDRTPIAEYLRVVSHEAGHALAFPHEHMHRKVIARLDREATIRDFMARQGWSRREVEEQVFTPLEESSLLVVPGMPVDPDEASIMCYRFEGHLTIDGRPVVGGTEPNIRDLTFARRAYPKAGSPVDPGPIGPGPRPEPPPPPKPDPAVPSLKRGRWSKVSRYVPSSGPARFRIEAMPGEPLIILVDGEGKWVVEVLPIAPGSAPLKLKSIRLNGDNTALMAAATEAEYYLTVRHANAGRPGKFRVRYS